MYSYLYIKIVVYDIIILGDNMDIEKRMDELIEKINKASYEYYVNDNPTITDQEYDDYYSLLLHHVLQFPEYDLQVYYRFSDYKLSLS